MRLLLDEMYPPVVAEQLRARGHDVVSVHDPEYRWLEGAPDEEVFAAAGVMPDVAHEKVDLEFASEQDAVDEYTNTFGPFVTARTVLEPQGRWPEFVQAFADLIRRFNLATDGTARIQGEYLLITVER